MLLAAVDAFAASGYRATTTREIAERAGLSPAGVYVHYRSKELLLYEISVVGSQSVLKAVKDELAEAADPIDGLRRFVTAFVAWHARNQTLARVIQYELNALTPEHRTEIDALQGRCERLLRAELRRGAEAGTFTIDDQRTTATAILSMGVDVARWYSGGPPAPGTLGARYADLAARMVGAHRS
jgi:AcrR family transcriptional regulator